MKLKKKKETREAPQRNPRLTQKRPSSYHYSAQRSQTDRTFDRNAPQANAVDQHSARNASGARSSVIERSLSVLAGGLIVLSLGYVLSLTPKADVRVESSGNNLVPVAELQEAADTFLSKSINNRTKITIDTKQLEAELKTAFPSIREVNVSVSVIRHRPVVSVQSAVPSAIIAGVNGSYVVSSDGIALFEVTKAPKTTPLNDLPTIQDQSSFKIEAGKPVLTRSQLSVIDEVRSQLQAKNIGIDTVTVRGGGAELQVKPRNVSYYVKFNFFEDPKKAAGTYLAVKERLERDKQTPLEYVDVRIPERAYVK